MYQLIKRLIPSTVRTRLRDAASSMTDGYYRSIARHLSSHTDDDTTGLTYFFEVQPYDMKLALQGYFMGLFPTTAYTTGYVRWCDPTERGILPIREFHVPAKLQKMMKKEPYEVRVDVDFYQVMENCAEGRGITHITTEYKNLYMQLYEMGLAHSVSVWKDSQMVGGRFGVAIGGYFSGESSFSRAPEAGKVSLVRLSEILAAGGFVLRDTGWPTDFMAQFGGFGMPRAEFHKLHSHAITVQAHFDANAPALFTSKENQANTQ